MNRSHQKQRSPHPHESRNTRSDRSSSRTMDQNQRRIRGRSESPQQENSDRYRSLVSRMDNPYRSGIEQFSEGHRSGRSSQRHPSVRGSATHALERDSRYGSRRYDDRQQFQSRYQDQHDDPVEGPRDDRFYQSNNRRYQDQDDEIEMDYDESRRYPSRFSAGDMGWEDDLDLDDAYEYHPDDQDRRDERQRYSDRRQFEGEPSPRRGHQQRRYRYR